MSCTRMFKAEEMLDLSVISDLYGGGMYELWARGKSVTGLDRPGNLTAKRRWEIEGPSKPLGDVAVTREVGPVSVQAPVQPQGMGGMGDNVVIAMMQMQSQQMQAQAARDAQNQQNFLQMMTALLGNSKTESQQMMQMIVQMTTQQAQAQAQMMATMLASRGGGPDEFSKMIDIVNKVKGVGGEDDGGQEMNIGKIVADAADAIQGMHGIMSLKQGLPSPVTSADPNGAGQS